MKPTCLLLLAALPLAPALHADVVINEIMYHPSSENTAEEYVELLNTGAAAVDVGGWKFTSGVGFTIPAATSIPAGGFLVVAANGAAFSAKYPAVSNYVAGWTGRLSNSSNHLQFDDALGVKMDEVTYTDDGDWAERRQQDPPDFGHRGWHWYSDADGFGKSLELVNAAFDNDEGQNWLPSTTAQGTPGAANSAAAADIAPVIDKADHFPLVPKSTDAVAVTCRVRDDHGAALTVQLHYRNDGAGSFTTAAMFDDGLHADAAAGDGIFGEVIPAKANGTIVEFYFTAGDGSLTRTMPAPARDYLGALGQTQNLLYQVDDAVYAGAQPIYRMVMRAADRAELAQINANSPAAPFATSDQTQSHAKFNATWLSHDGTGDSIVYLSGVRNRGNSSRSLSPQSYNVSFRNGDTWKGVTALNLNTQNTAYQLLGSAIFRKAGLTMAESRAVQVRVNGVNHAGSGAPSYGLYCANEVANSDFADHHFPLDSSGNLYRARRLDSSGGADLRDDSGGQPAATADPAPYRVNYFKKTNESEDNWADLIGLTKTLAKGTSDAPTYTATYTPDYVSAVEAAADTVQWERFLAVNTIADNTETNITNGDGDDYFLYFGVNDPRAVFITYDLDSIFGRSGSSSDATHNLFRMARSDIGANLPMPLHPFIIHPRYAREYLAEVKRLIDGPFSAAEFATQADKTLGGVASTSVINAMKTFHNTRLAYIAGEMPLSLSGISATTTGGAALTVTSGYPQSTAATCNLLGKSDCTRTASVKVNGVAAAYTPWKVTNVGSFTTSIGDWQASNVTLTPGVNRLFVQAFDAADEEIERSFFDVWYDDGSVASVSGAQNTTWTAAGGPYQVTATVTVANGATLTIQPGTTVYLASGVGMTVAAGGRIIAEGTEAQPIRFTRAPGGSGNGGTITINGNASSPETHFYHTYFEFGGDPAVTCAANSNVILDHCEWLRTDVAYLHLDGGSFIVSHCIFPTSAAGTYFEGVHGANAAPPAGGRAIIHDSFFGKCHSRSGDYNDVMDFTGGNRPGAILEFYNNVMTGSDDDLLDIDGTDMWVEGNIFMHVHRSNSPDSASAISGGNDGGGGTGSRRTVTAIDTATEQLTCGTHGFATGQEVVATALLGSNFPAATPAMHDGGPFYTRVISTTVVKLYTSAADASADTNAINFTGGIGTGVTLSLCKLDGISHITMVGNLFYDLDNAATAKEGNFYTFLNNTVINQNNTGSQDAVTGVLNFGDDAYHEAAGMYAEGNIIQNAVALTRNYPGAGLQQTVTFNNNIFPPGMTWSGAGSGNLSADAGLNGIVIPTPTEHDYERVGAQIRQMFGLKPGSPARGTGPNGTDIGGIRPIGVSIGGAPKGTTNATGATITVGTLMTGYGIPLSSGAWPNGGSGWTHYKWRLDGGAWSAETPLTMPISINGLANGTHTVEATGKNDAGTYQDSTNLGSSARVSSVSWVVDTSYVPPTAAPLVQISEVLAKNTETLNVGGTFPDIIELRNAGTAAADISGWGLTDNSSLPFKYTISDGTMLAPGARLVIYASSAGAVPQPKTGFALSNSGDTLTLTKSAAAGGGIADSVAFGAQIQDVSIGRRETDGAWDMCVPTFGGANIVASQGSVYDVLINEWLADARILAGQDFVELINKSTRAVNIGNCFLTDNPQDWPQRHPIRQLTFIAPGGYVYLKADGDTNQGPEHLSFKLASSQGEIGLFDAALNPIDSIVYGPQTTDISEGRTPNGGPVIAFFTQPTPGAPNPSINVGSSLVTVNVVPANQVWKYFQSSTAAPANDGSGRTWSERLYDDSSWSSGEQLLYIEDQALTNTEGFAKTTLLTGWNTTHPYQTYYFRTHFTYSGPLNGATLTAQVMVDDGAIVYLNGIEIPRIRVPAGADTYELHADGNVGDASVETIDIPVASLLVGDNVLSVSVHQNSNDDQSANSGSSDIVWGIKVDASYPGGAPPVTVNLIPATQTWKYFQSPTAAPANDGSGRIWSEPLYTDTGWSAGPQLLYIESAALSNGEGFTKATALTGWNTTHPYQTYYFRTHFTYNGPLTEESLSATMMIDDGAIIYLNGVEIPRIRVGAGADTFLLHANAQAPNGGDAGVEIVSIPVANLVQGDNVLSVSVHQNSGSDQSATAGSSDIVWGMKLDATFPGSGSEELVINEVLAVNTALQNPDGSFAGWVELYNPGVASVDASDVSITNDVSDPRRFVLPAGTNVPAGGYVIVYCNGLAAPTSTAPFNSGFGLSGAGGGVFLFKPVVAGGGLQGSVNYGSQLTDFSIGRSPNGTGAFALNVVTRGALNSAAATVQVTSVKINEWLTNGLPGWLELYNTSASPATLGGNFLTDNLADRTKNAIRPLSFIAGTGANRWLQFIADNDNTATPGHVNFTLETGENIGIYTPGGTAVDTVGTSAVPPGATQGRFADGSSAILALAPTPGSSNTRWDTDNDGIPDAWELANGLDPNNPADAALDFDGDGQSNLAEYLAGTNPKQSGSRLAASLVESGTPGQFAIRFNAIAGKTYSVRYKTEITDATWTKLADVSAQGADTLIEVADPASGGQPRRFYQVVTPQQP